MKRFYFIFFYLLFVCVSHAQPPLTPDKILGELFTDVQMSRIFPDSKTFVDCIPKRDPKEILADYISIKNNPNLRFSLKLFVEANFTIPDTSQSTYVTKEKDIKKHIENLWTVLKRKSDSSSTGSSLLPLPNSYIVPGGRFREIYYWDSYFTMLGLRESGEYELIENMVKNFAYLIEQYGHIPNGNRTYYLSRSQPPFFSLMVELLAGIKGDSVYLKYLPALEKEYKFWNWNYNDPEEYRYVTMGEWRRIYRYNDQYQRPRQEAFYEDSLLAKKIKEIPVDKKSPEIKIVLKGNQNEKTLYRHLRASAESGWDFSSRWFYDHTSINTVRTNSISPVDLNCLIWHLQSTLAKAYSLAGNKEQFHFMDSAAMESKKIVRHFFYDQKQGWYMDYDIGFDRRNSEMTLAGMYPLFFKLVSKEDAAAVVATLKKYFLKNGGVVTTLRNTGQQWDAPNGWAPLEWITIIGLENYGYHELAKQIAIRWVGLNKKVFQQTGKLMEKYNVVNTNLKAGGGEYPSQDGFGWTNGVLLALINKYNLK